MTDPVAASVRRVATLVLATAWCVYVGSAGGTLATGDAVAMFEAAKSLIDHGTLEVPASQSSELWRGTDGRYYTPFGIAQSLYDVPFIVAGRRASSWLGVDLGDSDALPKAFVAVASTIPAAVAAAFGFLLSWRLSGAARASVMAAFALAFGTLLWPYAKFGFNAALTTAALTAGIYAMGVGALDRHRPLAVAGGLGMGIALLTRHEMAIAAAVALVWVAWATRRGRRQLDIVIGAALPIFAAIALWMTLNVMRYGHPLRSGHEPAFSLDGVRAYVLSPSGALLLYAPPAIAGLGLVALARAGNRLAGLLLGASVAMTAFYASLEDWLGTRSYGPRYLVPLLPLLVAPLAVWIRHTRTALGRGAVGLVVAAGIAVQIPAVAIDFSRAGIAAGQPPQAERRDDWRWAPLAVNARMLPAAATATFAALSSNTRSPGAAGESAGLIDRVPFGLDLWPVHLFQLGVVSAAAAVVLGLLPFALAIWFGRRAVRAALAIDRALATAG